MTTVHDVLAGASLSSQRLRHKLFVVFLLMFVLPCGYLLVCLYQLAGVSGVFNRLPSITQMALLGGLPAAVTMSVGALVLLQQSLGKISHTVDDVEKFLRDFKTVDVPPPLTHDEAEQVSHYITHIIPEFRRHITALDSFAQELYDANRDLSRKALTDPVTGLYGTDHAMKVLGTEIQRAVKHGDPLSILLVNVDDFQAMTHTYGQRAADQALQEVARLLSTKTRAIDLVARDRHSRFFVLMVETAAADAARFAEAVQTSIAEHRFTAAGRNVQIPVTVSTGTASLGETTASVDDLLKAAEANMLVTASFC